MIQLKTVSVDKTLGYAYFLDREHPLASARGKVYFHRHVASFKLGRWLKPNEVCHHIDGDKANNDIENIVVITHSEHAQAHGLGVDVERCKRPCEQCGKMTVNKRFCSYPCSHVGTRKATRPSQSQLKEDMINLSWCAMGRKYGVSDNAVRKWARGYGLL